MDQDNDMILSKTEAVDFWDNNFAKINAQAMFNEVRPPKSPGPNEPLSLLASGG